MLKFVGAAIAQGDTPRRSGFSLALNTPEHPVCPVLISAFHIPILKPQEFVMALDTSKIEEERKALQILADAAQTCSDDERSLIMQEIQKSAANLQKLCDELQAEADKIAEANPAKKIDFEAVVEVVLTPEQRKRVLEKTGIDVPSVRIQDPDATLTKNMAHIEPDFIEQSAIAQAERFKSLVEDAGIETPGQL